MSISQQPVAQQRPLVASVHHGLLFSVANRRELDKAHDIIRVMQFDVPEGLAGGRARLHIVGRLRDDVDQETVADGVISLFFFDSETLLTDDIGRPSLDMAVHRSRIHLGEGPADLVEILPETLPRNVVIYSYIDRSCAWRVDLVSFEVLTRTTHFRFVPDIREEDHENIEVTTDAPDKRSLRADAGEMCEGRWRAGPLALHKTWSQQGSRLWLTWLGRDFYMDMPDGFDINTVPAEKLRLAELLLFDKLEEEAFGIPAIQRQSTFSDFEDTVTEETIEPTNVLLCYSAGEDSTAALVALPEYRTTPVYIARPYTRYRVPKGARVELGDRAFERAAIAKTAQSREVVELPTTFETIGLSVGLRHGFRDGIGYAAGAVLLSETMDANVIALGPPLGVTTLSGGHTWRDVFNNTGSPFNRQLNMFAAAGVILSYPIGVLSEVVTNRLSRSQPERYVAVPCANTTAEGEPCGQCFKCFRKGLLSGQSITPGAGTRELLEKRPLPMASCVVYASQQAGFTELGLDEFADMDVSFLSRYYTSGLRYFLPRGVREEVAENFARLGVDPMSPEDEVQLRDMHQRLGKPGRPSDTPRPERRADGRSRPAA